MVAIVRSFFTKLVNYKHFDTNGDGTIDVADVTAIERNWSRLPTLTNNSGSGDGVPFFVDLDSTRLADAQEIPIALGTAEEQAEGVYSVAFSIYFELKEDLQNAPSIQVSSSWLGSQEELIQIERFFPEEQRLDVAISRTDQVARSGQGEVAYMDIVMEDVILFHHNEMDIRIDHIRAVGAEEQRVAVQSRTTQQIVNTELIATDLPISVTPNPVETQLFVDAPTLEVEHISIVDTRGQVVAQYAATDAVSVDQLPSGLYVIIVQTTAGTWSQKVNIQ